MEGLIKEADSGKNDGKPGDLIVEEANEERRNSSQKSTQILNLNTTSAVSHELLHADLSYVLSLVGSKKERHTPVVKFKMLWVQEPTSEDGIFSCMTHSDTFRTIQSLCIISFQRYSPRQTLRASRVCYVKNIESAQERCR